MVTTTASPAAASNRRTTRRREEDTTPTATETAKQNLGEAAKHYTEATRCNPYHRLVGTDTGLEDVETNGCYSVGQSGCQSGKWPAISAA